MQSNFITQSIIYFKLICQSILGFAATSTENVRFNAYNSSELHLSCIFRNVNRNVHTLHAV